MPIYEYMCLKCDKEVERISRISERVIPNCCGQEMEPIIRMRSYSFDKSKGSYGTVSTKREHQKLVDDAKFKTTKGVK